VLIKSLESLLQITTFNVV